MATLAASAPRRLLLTHSFAFVLGFAAIFTVFGIAVGQFLTNIQNGLDYLRWFGGIAVIVLGIHTIGLLRIPLLDRQAKISAEERLPRGRILSSFLLGVFFAAGWSPCVGIILSSIFAVAATQGARAGVLFFCYALGLGIPFILTALAFSWAAPFLRRMNRHLGIISAISGIFLIVVGIMLLTDQFVRLATILPIYEPEVGGSGSVSDVPLVFGAFIAAFGGLLSFLSPCVMPLVPGYLGYLTGTVVQTSAARGEAERPNPTGHPVQSAED